MKDRNFVVLMAKRYRQCKILLTEHERGFRQCSEMELIISRQIVDHVNLVVRYLSERDRFIIYHEVIDGKTGMWYQGKLSPPSYYRHRKKAYKTFIKFLNTNQGE